MASKNNGALATPTTKPEPSKAQPTTMKDLLGTINKKYGQGSIMHGPGTGVKVDSWQSGIPTLDDVLGCGGIPKGRIMEIFGAESSGKTTTCLTIAAACQRTEFIKTKLSGTTSRLGVVSFIDAEHALDPTWATNIGVNMDQLLLSQPNSGEEGLGIALELAQSGQVDLIIVDSVAALTPQAELDGEMEDQQIGLQARMMSKAMRKLTAACSNSGCSILFINQIREKIGVMFGSPETTPGGRALKFYASLRMEVRKGKPIDVKQVRVGMETKVKVLKNKVGVPFRTCEFDIMFGSGGIYGVDYAANLIAAAAAAGVISRSSSYYLFDDLKVNGLEALQEKIKSDPALLERVNAQFQAKIKTATVRLEDLDDEELVEATGDDE